jgi:hypothetical protein
VSVRSALRQGRVGFGASLVVSFMLVLAQSLSQRQWRAGDQTFTVAGDGKVSCSVEQSTPSICCTAERTSEGAGIIGERIRSALWLRIGRART